MIKDASLHVLGKRFNLKINTFDISDYIIDIFVQITMISKVYAI